jgi:hypothetical protein
LKIWRDKTVGLWLQCVTTLETVDLIVIGIAAWNLFTS